MTFSVRSNLVGYIGYLSQHFPHNSVIALNHFIMEMENSIVCAQHSVMTQLVDQTFILKLFNLEEHQIQDFFIRYHQESLCVDVRLTIQEETCPVWHSR